MPRLTFADKSPRLLAFLVVLATGSAPMALGTAAERGATQHLIVLYDPDTNHQAIVDITSTFNSYLKESGVPLLLQPVTSVEKLEELLQAPEVDFAIISSAYLHEHPHRFKPLLVPEANGEVFYRKLLLDRSSDAPPNLSGKNIAATSGEGSDRAAGVLTMIKRGGIPVDGALIIPVSKDVDALLALTFGQVQAALVTPRSVEVLKRINPTAAQTLRKIYETDRIGRSPLCALNKSSAALTGQLVAALQKMDQDADGKRAISSLGFDRWVSYSATTSGGGK